MEPAATKTRSTPSRPAIAWGLPALAAALVAALSWLSRGYTADDAFIPGRYALRLVAGQGYTFRDGPATDGITGPLLLAIEVPAAALGLDPVLASKLVGALALMIAAFAVTRRLVDRATGTLAAGYFVLCLLGSGALVMHAQSGLETGLTTCLLTLAGLGATSVRRRRGDDAAVLVGLALVPWLRPELVPVSWALGALWVHRVSPPTRRRQGLVAAAAATLGLGSVVLFRALLFGQVIPLSAQAKPTDLGNGLGYTLVSLAVLFGLVLVPALHATRSDKRDAALAGALLIALVTVTLGGGDWMPGGRLLVPLAPLTLMLGAIGLSRFVATHRHRRGLLALALVFLVPQLLLTKLVVEQADEVALSRATAGTALRSLLARDARVVALVDVGFLAYRAPWQPFDLAGVTDPAIGGRPGAHCAKPVTIDDLLARDVDTLVLHSAREPRVEDGVLTALRAHPVEQALAASPRLSEQFTVVAVVPYARNYHYVVLRRRR